MAEEFKIGDVVQVKSGGPAMTVFETGEELGRKFVRCQWFHFNRQTGYEDKLTTKSFAAEIVMKVKEAHSGRYFVTESTEHVLPPVK